MPQQTRDAEGSREGPRETLEGYVVDLICLRRYPQGELGERARGHTRDCALHGHCIESGYGLVSEDGRLQLLDPKATPLVVERVSDAEPQHGIFLRAERVDGRD